MGACFSKTKADPRAAEVIAATTTANVSATGASVNDDDNDNNIDDDSVIVDNIILEPEEASLNAGTATCILAATVNTTAAAVQIGVIRLKRSGARHVFLGKVGGVFYQPSPGRRRYITDVKELRAVIPLPGGARTIGVAGLAALDVAGFDSCLFLSAGGLVGLPSQPPVAVRTPTPTLLAAHARVKTIVALRQAALTSPVTSIAVAVADDASTPASTPDLAHLTAVADPALPSHPPPPPSAAIARSAAKVYQRFDGRDAREWRSLLTEIVRLPSQQLRRSNHASLMHSLGGICPYTKMALPTPPRAQEVEHTFECQALAHALRHSPLCFEAIRAAAPAWGHPWDAQPRALQAALAHARDTQNSRLNLSITTHVINKKKGGAFTTSLNDLEAYGGASVSLEARLIESFMSGVSPMDERAARAAALNVAAAVRNAEGSYVASLLDHETLAPHLEARRTQASSSPGAADASPTSNLNRITARRRLYDELGGAVSDVISALL